MSNNRFEQTLEYIRAHTQYKKTKIGLILGSGLSPLAESVEQADQLDYSAIPHFAHSTVKGHSGHLVLGRLQGHEIVVMQGRFHYYEGHSIKQITYPIRIMHLLGVETLIVTNAAGGLAPRFNAGELMLITDHINLVGMAGVNPLIGPNNPDFGPRFPDMSQPYDLALQETARQVAQAQNISLQEGVYVGLAGPSFETPAEVRFLQNIGAEAVGMSTVHEVIVARHMNMRVLGLSGITNVHRPNAAQKQETTHQEVLETGQLITPRLISLIQGILARL